MATGIAPSLSWLNLITGPAIVSGTTATSTIVSRQPNLAFGNGFNITPDPDNAQNIITVNAQAGATGPSGSAGPIGPTGPAGSTLTGTFSTQPFQGGLLYFANQLANTYNAFSATGAQALLPAQYMFGPQSDVSASVTSAGGKTELQRWITYHDTLSPAIQAAGTWTFYYYAYVNSTSGVTTPVFDVSQMSDNSIGKTLFSITGPQITSTVPALYSASFTTNYYPQSYEGDFVSVLVSATTTNATPIIAHFVCDGQSYQSNVVTPLYTQVLNVASNAVIFSSASLAAYIMQAPLVPTSTNSGSNGAQLFVTSQDGQTVTGSGMTTWPGGLSGDLLIRPGRPGDSSQGNGQQGGGLFLAGADGSDSLLASGGIGGNGSPVRLIGGGGGYAGPRGFGGQGSYIIIEGGGGGNGAIGGDGANVLIIGGEPGSGSIKYGKSGGVFLGVGGGTGNQIGQEDANTQVVSVVTGNCFTPYTDVSIPSYVGMNPISIGNSSQRFLNLVGMQHQTYATINDLNSSMQLNSSSLQFGSGGPFATNASISYVSSGSLVVSASNVCFTGSLVFNSTGSYTTSNNISVSGLALTYPIVQLNGTVKSGNCTVTLPNTPGLTIYFDLTNVTFGGNSIVFTTGTGTSATITGSGTNGKYLLTVAIVANNFVSAG